MNVKKLCVSAIMLALGTVLSLITVYNLPLGGSITLFSMVPVCLISIVCGIGYAVIPCVVYGLIQFFLSGAIGWGLTPAVLIGCIFFDYIAAFGVLSLSGIFTKKGQAGIIYGTGIALLLRFACHFVSGIVLFTNFEPFEMLGILFGGNPYIYSIVYNGSFMLPELIMTLIAMFILTKSKLVEKLKRSCV